jgi:hypothetical protein
MNNLEKENYIKMTEGFLKLHPDCDKKEIKRLLKDKLKKIRYEQHKRQF